MATRRHYLTYVSQLDPVKANWGLGDCGLACVAMIVSTVTPARPTVNEVARKVNLPKNFTIASLGKVLEAATHFDTRLELRSGMQIADIERELNDSRAIIWLVHYPRLLHKFSATFRMGHFITLHGMDEEHFYYDDPFWSAQKDGEDVRIPKRALIEAAYAGGSTFTVPPGGYGLVLRSHKLPEVRRKPVPVEPVEPVEPIEPIEPVVLAAGKARLSGTIRGENGEVVANASVRLYGEQPFPPKAALVAKVPARGQVLWDRTLTGFSGTRWNCWEALVRDQSGLPFETFKNEVLEKNPQLIEDEYLFLAEKSYLIPRPVSVLAWSRSVSGVAGARWEVYERYIKGQVEGMTAQLFIKESPEHNPELMQSGFVFQPERSYRFPENLWGGMGIEWSRRQNGLSGNRWEIWEQHVRNVVPALGVEESFAEFSEGVVAHNPQLAQDGWLFKPDQEYLLPAAAPRDLSAWIQFCDDEGRFVFEELAAGSYEIEVQAAGQPTLRRAISVKGSRSLALVLREVTRELPAAPIQPFPHIARALGRQIVIGEGSLLPRGLFLPDLAHLPDEAQEAAMVAARARGFNVLRFIMARRDVSHRMLLERLGALLERMESHNLRAIVAFADANLESGLHVRGDSRFDVYGRLSLGWYEAEFRRHFLPLVKKITRAFRNDGRIVAWELGHNLNPMLGESPNPEPFIIFANTVAGEIRAAGSPHLIGPGIPSTGALGMDSAQSRRLYDLPGIDLVTTSLAPVEVDEGTRSLDSAELDALAAYYVEQDGLLARRLGKPFILTLVGGEADRWRQEGTGLLEGSR